MINKIKNSNMNFQARPIASIEPFKNKFSFLKNKVSSEIILFQLGEKDCDFLYSMDDSINLDRLSPALASHPLMKYWRNCIVRPIDFINERPDSKTILAVVDSRPFGIANYKIDPPEPIDLTYIATWPIMPHKNVKYAGKSIMRQIFQDAKEEDIQSIGAFVLETPKPSFDFLQKLGFREGKGLVECYDAPREKFIEAINQLDKYLLYKKINNGKEVDLGSRLNINF